MAKFLDKKEQVFDVKLTTYGRYLLSVGGLKPAYYAFFDDNVIYDSRYISIGRRASATVLFSGVPAVGQTIQIISTDGTTKTYTAHASTTDASAGEFNRGGSVALCVAGLASCIEHANGHNGKIAVFNSTTNNELTLTQATEGADGNSTITENLDNVTVSNFSGGVDDNPRIAEPQNDIHNRIKNETQYIESLTLFEGVESSDSTNDGTVSFFDLQELAAKRRMRKDVFRFDTAIGDANLDGDPYMAPAWKVVALQSQISSSFAKDETTFPSGSINIPQININANYILKATEPIVNAPPRDVRALDVTTDRFIDGKIITLEQIDPLVYVEEKNTQLFTENFDIEIFDILTDTDGNTSLERKFFKKNVSQIKDGLMVSLKKIAVPETEITSGSVEYYFDVLSDSQIDRKLACRGAETFNKDSYYIDFDFDCEKEDDEDIFFDIYGSVTEPEICR